MGHIMYQECNLFHFIILYFSVFFFFKWFQILESNIDDFLILVILSCQFEKSNMIGVHKTGRIKV